MNSLRALFEKMKSASDETTDVLALLDVVHYQTQAVYRLDHDVTAPCLLHDALYHPQHISFTEEIKEEVFFVLFSPNEQVSHDIYGILEFFDLSFTWLQVEPFDEVDIVPVLL